MTDKEFLERLSEKGLNRLYYFFCSNEVKMLFIKNGWKCYTDKRIEVVQELYEELKPAFIDFAHSGVDFSSIDKIPFLFSEHLKFLNRRKKLEKIQNNLQNDQTFRKFAATLR